jgi:hypothetical protein
MEGGAMLRVVVWGAALLLIIVVVWNRVRRRPGPKGARVRRGPGPGAAGAVYDMLNEDKRRAIEIIVEGRAELTDPERADGTPHSGQSGKRPRS